MKNFLIAERGNEGCDYSIGCGSRVTVIEAESRDAVFELLHRVTVMTDEEIYARDFSAGSEELTKKLRFYWDRFHEILNDGDHHPRTSVIVYEIEGAEAVPLSMWRRERDSAQKAKQDAAKEAKERALFERLKSQFEPKA